MNACHNPHLLRLREAGMSLIELMVALAIGLFLIGGVISVFGKTRDLYRTNESAARLQETARYAMSTIETDLRMANFWGLHNRPDLIRNTPALDPDNLPAPDPAYALPVELSGAGYPTAINACGDLWGIKLAAYIEGSNNAYALDCAAFGTAAPIADQLTVRRAASSTMDNTALLASDGQIKVQTSRAQGVLFGDTTLPAGYTPPLSETRALVVHGYYIDQDSDQTPGTPSLRRKSLGAVGGAPAILDEQIVPNVEDLQVEIGVDRSGDQNADFFVPADTAVNAADAVVAVRVWLLVRAEQPELGFTDDRAYQYADRASFVPGDGFRRLLASRTLALRNSRR